MEKLKGKFGEWTPVEEGMPADGGMYLVTTKKGDVLSTKLHGDRSSWGLPKSMKVIAWMPMPKRYRKR